LSSVVPEAPRNAGEMLARAREFLTRKGTLSPRLEAELLVAHALGLDRLKLFLQFDRPVTAVEVARARELLVRRGRNEPVAYITGSREFYGRSYRVTRDVLVPRPETELIVDLARAAHRTHALGRVLDIGAGSGCLATSLFLELDAPSVTAVDISAAALAVASDNAARLGANVEFVEGDGAECLGEREPFDLIVSNPPYIEPGEAPTLSPDVREWEPSVALFTPEQDPEHWLRRLADTALARLPERQLEGGPSRGLALIELGHRQASRALEIARERGLSARTHKDYGGVERVLELRRG
jgi:release factor glutamine methyltransferase